MSAVQVGNEAARDEKKHCAAYILRSAICEVIPSVGALMSIHYDKRGAKMTLQYCGEDCGAEKEKVENKAGEICSAGVSVDALQLGDDDKASLKSFSLPSTTADVGGVTVKKFTANAGKQQLIVEYTLGAPKKTDAPAAGSAAPAAKKEKAAGGGSKVAKAAPPSAYDDISQVSDQVVAGMMAMLKAEGVAIDGKEEALKAKMQDLLNTPLVLLKNTAYTKGFSAPINAPIGNFVVKR